MLKGGLDHVARNPCILHLLLYGLAAACRRGELKRAQAFSEPVKQLISCDLLLAQRNSPVGSGGGVCLPNEARVELFKLVYEQDDALPLKQRGQLGEISVPDSFQRMDFLPYHPAEPEGMSVAVC